MGLAEGLEFQHIDLKKKYMKIISRTSFYETAMRASKDSVKSKLFTLRSYKDQRVGVFQSTIRCTFPKNYSYTVIFLYKHPDQPVA